MVGYFRFMYLINILCININVVKGGIMKKSLSWYALLSGFALFGLFISGAASSADLTKLVESCNSCHGTNGISTEADVPSIASSSEEYLKISLMKFQKNERPCTETEIRSGSNKGAKSDMCGIAKDLSESDIQQIAAYYAGKAFVRIPQKFDEALAQRGKQIHSAKCNTCHSDSGTLPDDDVGILGGQNMTYLTNTLKHFREGKRKLPKGMKQKIESLDDTEIEALIHFYGSVPDNWSFAK